MNTATLNAAQLKTTLAIVQLTYSVLWTVRTPAKQRKSKARQAMAIQRTLTGLAASMQSLPADELDALQRNLESILMSY
jgi:hypothetical protein